MLPQSALDHERRQDALHDFTDRAVRRAWRRMRAAGRTWQAAWDGGVAAIVTDVLAGSQESSVASSEAYMAAVLAELELASQGTPDLIPSSLAGVAGDGRDVASGAFGAVLATVESFYTSDLTSQADRLEQALAEGEDWIAEYAATLVADADRAAQAVMSATEPLVRGYIRMVEPGACSRCVVLAGRFYRWNEGFDRHPNCRCRHIPATENIATDLHTNPDAYFHSLSAAEQDRTFTKAGAEAIRMGADISQVVNARRGMSTAQQNPRGWIPKGRLQAVTMHGHDVFVTSEGVTKRGVYGKSRGNKPLRLMPESILSLAKDRDDAIRLLRLYGFIT